MYDTEQQNQLFIQSLKEHYKKIIYDRDAKY